MSTQRRITKNQIDAKMLYPYRHEDITTWAYLDCMVFGGKENPKIKWIKNPDFKYQRLIKNYWRKSNEKEI